MIRTGNKKNHPEYNDIDYKIKGGVELDCSRPNSINRTSASNNCCVASTGCSWDGTLRNVVTEPIYVQKTYDAVLAHLQALKTVGNLQLKQVLPPNAQITEVLDVRAKKYFNPSNINDPKNLRINPIVSVTGAQFVEDGSGNPVKVVGPDGLPSQKILFTNTKKCDSINRGTPIYGTQNVELSGNVELEIDVIYTVNDDCCSNIPMPISNSCGCGSCNSCNSCGCNCGCGCGTCGTIERETTLTANVELANISQPLVITSFFQLCMPSVYDTAFLPRFAEFCNIGFDARLVSNNICRDICVDPCTGVVTANVLIIALLSCEKKIIVPVQLCVLSTGFPVLEAEIAPITQTFPQLFPNQIDEETLKNELNQNNQNCNCGCCVLEQ